MPDNVTGCPQQARPKQAVPVHLRRDTRQQSRQNEQFCREHRTSLRTSQAPCAPSAAPLMQPLLQPSAHFNHRMIQDPRGFLLGRFSNAGRCRASAKRSAATRVRKPSPMRSFGLCNSLLASNHLRCRRDSSSRQFSGVVRVLWERRLSERRCLPRQARPRHDVRARHAAPAGATRPARRSGVPRRADVRTNGLRSDGWPDSTRATARRSADLLAGDRYISAPALPGAVTSDRSSPERWRRSPAV